MVLQSMSLIVSVGLYCMFVPVTTSTTYSKSSQHTLRVIMNIAESNAMARGVRRNEPLYTW